MVAILTADKASLDEKLESTSKAQREAQSQVAALEKEVSMLQQQLADAKAEGQKRLEQLEVTREKDMQRSKEEAEKSQAAVKGLEKAEQQLQAELAAEKSQCAKLKEEVAALHKEKISSAHAGESESAKAAALQKQVEMLTAEKAALDGKLETASTALRAEADALRSDLDRAHLLHTTELEEARAQFDWMRQAEAAVRAALEADRRAWEDAAAVVAAEIASLRQREVQAQLVAVEAAELRSQLTDSKEVTCFCVCARALDRACVDRRSFVRVSYYTM